MTLRDEGAAAPSRETAATYLDAEPRERIEPDAADSTPSEGILGIAERLTELGLFLFPTKADEKAPAVTGWQQKSTRDLATIEGWVRRGWNLGIDTEKSGVVGIDEDAAGALDDWKALCPVDVPPTFTTRSQRGGRHELFRTPAGRLYRSSNVRFRRAGLKIDVKARGGLLMAPGSEFTTGAYSIAEDVEIAELPEEVAEAWLRPVEAVVPAAVDGLGPQPTFIACEEPRKQPLSASAVRWLDAVLGGEEERLRAAQDLGDGEEPRWRQLALDVANRYVLVHNAAPDTFPLDALRERFLDAAPTDRDWTETNNEDRWLDAIADVGGWAKPIPEDVLDAAADFGDPGPDESAGEDRAPVRDSFEQEVAREMARQDVRDEARRRIAARDANGVDLPPLARLDEFLDEPDPDVEYRIDGVWPAGGRVVFSAAQKAGKTTTISNVLRSLADSEDFLGRFRSEPVRRAILIDDELDENMLRRWLRDQGIANTDRIELVTLRGRLSTFNIMEPETRARWARHLGSADVLLFDCLRPALDALGLDENHDAGRFLEAFDELLVEAGIPEAVVVHHMGHGSERSRGDSRILDWPDAVWKLVRGEDELAQQRFFSAYGRDVQVPESQLAFDEITRRLSIAGGSRKEQKLTPAISAVLEILRNSKEALSGGALEKSLVNQGIGRNLARDAVRSAVARDLVAAVPQGPGRPTLHSLAVDDFDQIEEGEEL